MVTTIPPRTAQLYDGNAVFIRAKAFRASRTCCDNRKRKTAGLGSVIRYGGSQAWEWQAAGAAQTQCP